MKIMTWNINGIRAARRENSLKQLLDSLDADIVCLQETKVTRDMLDEATAIVDGYTSYFSFSKVRSGYSGVATFCRETFTPVAAEEGISAALNPEPCIGCYGNLSDFTTGDLTALDAEGRAVLTEHSTGDGRSVVVINVYCPRADKENEERVAFKLRFYEVLQLRAEALVKSGRDVIVLGDINTSHRMIDHCDPGTLEEFSANPGRKWMNHFVKDLHPSSDPSSDHTSQVESSLENSFCEEPSGGMFVDTFRYFHPTQRDAFTNWCTVTSARQTNYGTRIDYIFANERLAVGGFRDCNIRPDIEGSDHCPVVATLNTVFKCASRPPRLCTKYMPEFSGKQSKLNAYFKPKGEEIGSPQGFDDAEARKDTSAKDYKGCAVTVAKRPGSVSSLPSAKRVKTAAGKSTTKQNSLLTFFGKLTNTQKVKQMDLIKAESVSDNEKEVKQAARPNGDEAQLTEPNSLGSSQNSSSSVEFSSSSEDKSSTVEDNSLRKDTEETKKAEVTFWKNVLKGPRPPPRCPGHNEPSVLRTVKIKGPNKGRQFYCCARPEGRSDNPEARCKFFKWVK